jgi:hypothetical protein
MQIEPNENASKRMCTSQFSNRCVIAAAPHSGTRRTVGLQPVEASDLATRIAPVGQGNALRLLGQVSGCAIALVSIFRYQADKTSQREPT